MDLRERPVATAPPEVLALPVIPEAPQVLRVLPGKVLLAPRVLRVP